MIPYYQNDNDSWIFLMNYTTVEGDKLDVYFCSHFQFAKRDYQVILAKFGETQHEYFFWSIPMLESMYEESRKGSMAPLYVGLEEAKRRGLILAEDNQT